MSKIDELIKKYCPDGVEYKRLGEIGQFVRGSGLQKKDFTDSGVGCIHYGQIYTYYKIFTSTTKSFVAPELASKLTRVKKGNLVIACTSENMEDVCKAVAWLGNEEIVTGGHSTVFSHNQDPKYIAYYFQSDMFAKEKRKYAIGTKVIEMKASNLAKIEIPVPPLPIQKEIVRILDKFTELEAELAAELAARKKQYEYYRNQLLSFGNLDKRGGVEYMALGDVCSSVTAGGDVPEKYQKGQLTPSPEFPFPIYSNGTNENSLYGYASSYRVKETAVTISARGTIGFHTVRKGCFTPIIRLLVLIPKKELLTPEYLNYALTQTVINPSKGSIPQLTVPVVKKIKIPVPPLSVQKEIVRILDKFDALTNDLTAGLPAELAARRQQYEYYRDKLLTFQKI